MTSLAPPPLPPREAHSSIGLQSHLAELAGTATGLHEVIIELIGATTTRQGFRLHAERDRSSYLPGVKVPDRGLAVLPLCRHGGHWSGTTRCYQLPHRYTANQTCRAETDALG
jgi:hypothetical protein